MFLMLKYKTHQMHVEDLKNEVLLDLIAGTKIYHIRINRRAKVRKNSSDTRIFV